MLGLLELSNRVEVQIKVLPHAQTSLQAFLVEPEDFDRAVAHAARHQVLSLAQGCAVYLLVSVEQVYRAN